MLIRRKSIFVNTVCVALISAVVEVLQYIFAVGSADIDDVILNTVGGLIGVSLFRVMELLLKDQTKKQLQYLHLWEEFFISHTFLGKQVTVVPFAQMC